jgi:uncharacterized protein YnzC (UPF0291/DUF896 family)
MPVTKEQIDRINQLARKSKAESLTLEETKEQVQLRRLYIDSVKASLVGQLEHTYIVDENGNKRKLPKKKPTRPQ